VGSKNPLQGFHDPERRQAFLAEYATGCTIEQAAEAVGVAPVTVHARRRSDPSFAAAFAMSQEYNTDALEDRLARMASGNVAALFGTLKARRPGKWGDRSRVEVAHTTGADALRSARDRARNRDQGPATVAQVPQPEMRPPGSAAEARKH